MSRVAEHRADFETHAPIALTKIADKNPSWLDEMDEMQLVPVTFNEAGGAGNSTKQWCSVKRRKRRQLGNSRASFKYSWCQCRSSRQKIEGRLVAWRWDKEVHHRNFAPGTSFSFVAGSVWSCLFGEVWGKRRALGESLGFKWIEGKDANGEKDERKIQEVLKESTEEV
ncbi:hypothetical protein K435DRAFT_851608 [Dendrothele bispora CBS 962.96]|uniref:Uncharacterized protein n=1 Tax=Dendrothele bispora (strain CBS 962.96) TaxID=1314807 RepID=A0A4S8MLP2_DENBC|nr:hypothetical protein K435DRAFT_851608 [Dendrothele bispora CBS 962.96]